MPRRKPTSTRQKKEERQLKRAVKRGEVDPPPPKPRKPKKSTRNPQNDASVSQESSKKLQSSFLKSSRQFLEETKELASTVPLPRPIAPESAILTESYVDTNSELTPLRRPRWRYDFTKKEVERNEEGLFTKWLGQTDAAIERWRLDDTAASTIARSPSSFERNLEVWRQLWRVTEMSQIILVLVDSRCPLLHFPPSLARYLSNHKVILVLTKVDITGLARASAWADYLRSNLNIPGLRVVQVQSYTSKEAGFYQQGRTRYTPQIPETFRHQLISAIRDLHSEMLEPPEKVRTNPKWLSNWKPPVKRDINWSAVLNIDDDDETGVESTVVAESETGSTLADEEGHPSADESSFLTIGLIGQPNVGKSSLLNAIFGQSKVRASKTPGKTKHYQTLFWTPEIRFVDCPGLVMPNYVSMEMQALSGILPISRVAAIPACIHFASQLLPLEEIFNLTHPKASEPPSTDNRTWRAGMKRAEKSPLSWTAMDVLVAYANKKGWVTAKAGRPDFSRAGNFILRALAEGQIPWGFWPPGTPLAAIDDDGSNNGIWIQPSDDSQTEAIFDVDDEESDEDGGEHETDEDSDEEGGHEEEDGDSEDQNDDSDIDETGSDSVKKKDLDDVVDLGITRRTAVGFAALRIDDAEDEEDDEETIASDDDS